MSNMMTVNLLCYAGDMSVNLNTVYEQAKVDKEDALAHNPVKVSG